MNASFTTTKNLIRNVTTTTIDPADAEKFDPGHITFEIITSILLWILVPGCGFFYSGMASSKNGLSLIMVSFWSIAIVSIQWYVIGYSLSFSTTASPFIGDFKNVFLIGVYDDVYGEVEYIPELAFCLYQGITATLAPSLILGVIAERGRILPAILFILLWTTLVYDPIASWSLNPRGWSARLGGNLIGYWLSFVKSWYMFMLRIYIIFSSYSFRFWRWRSRSCTIWGCW